MSRILTTIEVLTVEDAEKIIERYKQRCYIEQLFRLTKKQGFKIVEELEKRYEMKAWIDEVVVTANVPIENATLTVSATIPINP